MAESMLGKKLYEVGWSQGVLLPVLPWSVIYDTNDPISKIAKALKKQQQDKLYIPNLLESNIGVAFGITRKEDYLLLATQDCDIVKSLNEEPNVVAIRAFTTENPSILKYAENNSTRYFLLDRSRHLVADATIMAVIEKPALLNFNPISGILDNEIKERFARWIGHRFNRPAIHDNIVAAVNKPIVDNLAELRLANDPDVQVLDRVKEVRLAKIIGDPPYDVRLLFIVPESELPEIQIALAPLIFRIRGWFNPLAARLVAWNTAHLYGISVGDYLDTQQIYLEHYTYQGQAATGFTPPSHL